MRGLKYLSHWRNDVTIKVASLADAWIKIETPMQLLMHLPSHPSRMRGLKFSSVHICQLLISSHPSQMRGLKWQEREKKLEEKGRIPRGCVDRSMGREKLYYTH